MGLFCYPSPQKEAVDLAFANEFKLANEDKGRNSKRRKLVKSVIFTKWPEPRTRR